MATNMFVNFALVEGRMMWVRAGQVVLVEPLDDGAGSRLHFTAGQHLDVRLPAHWVVALLEDPSAEEHLPESVAKLNQL